MLESAWIQLIKIRHLLRISVTAGCFMMFTLLVLQDVKLYIQSLAERGHLTMRQHLSEDYAVIQGRAILYFNESISVEKLSSDRFRVTRRTLSHAAIQTEESSVESTPEQRDSGRFRLSSSRTLKSYFPSDPTKSNTFCGQKARQQLMSQACDWLREKQSPFTNVAKFSVNFTYSMVFVDDKRKLLYCEVPKVACTSWKVLFANLSGKVDPKDYHRLQELVHDTNYHPKVGFKYLKDYSPEERQYRLQHYYKFIVTRNPYSRIISAFENKLFADTPQSKWYHDNVGKHIIKKYRKNPSDRSLAKGSDATFEELVKFVGDPDEMNKNRFDAHWWNVNSICYPCLYKYDYIAKLETLNNDIENILKHISPQENLTLPYLNANKGSKSHKELTKIKAFFRDVSVADMSRLEKIYDVDLKTFGYSLTDNSLECQYDEVS